MDPRLINHWIHSQSENSTNIITYRAKKKINNTLSTENDSFELKKNGEFIQYYVSPNGKISLETGRFEIYNNSIYVSLNNPYQDFILDILYCDDNVLKVRKID